MTYLLLALAFLAVAGAVAVVAYRTAARRNRARTSEARTSEVQPRGAGWRPLAAAAVALLVLTAVFDNLMIAGGLFAYSDAHISGLRIGLAPIEDFAYPLSAVVLLPALWSLFRSRRAR